VNSIIGRIEAPRARQNINVGANLLVSGWAVDTTATGWAGISGVEVWNGAKPSGTKLATGTVGLARTDVADFLGANFTNSGFTAIVPSTALKAGALTLTVYLITPNKGSYLRTVAVTASAPTELAFPTDPVLVISRPQEGMAITQKQPNNKFTFNGFALDRNPTINPATGLPVINPATGQPALPGPGCAGSGGATSAIGTQSRGAGVASITAYIDSPKGDPLFPNFAAPCGGGTCVGISSPLVSNKGFLNVPGRPQGSFQSGSYGSDFDFSGWSVSINPSLLAPGPHTLYVTATSSITGKQTTASVNFFMLDFKHERVQP